MPTALNYQAARRRSCRFSRPVLLQFSRVTVEGCLGKVLAAREIGDLLRISHGEPKIRRAQAVVCWFPQRAPANPSDVISTSPIPDARTRTRRPHQSLDGATPDQAYFKLLLR